MNKKSDLGTPIYLKILIIQFYFQIFKKRAHRRKVNKIRNLKISRQTFIVRK